MSPDPRLVAALCAEIARADLDDRAAIEQMARAGAQRLAPLSSPSERAALVREALARAIGLGPVDALLRDPSVNEVMVNAGRELWVERAGTIARVGTLAPGEAELIIERAVTPLGRRIDRSTPVVDARLDDGSRICAVIPPVAIDGATLSIRRFAVRDVALDAFAGPELAALLVDIVAARCNVLVSGATSSGKTTLLNALAAHYGDHERIVSLEDTAELRLATPHVVRLEARAATADGVSAIGLDALVRTALRLRPDRLVVGEVRGREALDMVQALSTGHDGSWATVHANGPSDALRRIESMMWQAAPGWPADAVRSHVRHAIDVVVHVARQRDGRRRVTDVVEVIRPPGSGDVRWLARGDAVIAAIERRRTP